MVLSFDMDMVVDEVVKLTAELIAIPSTKDKPGEQSNCLRLLEKYWGKRPKKKFMDDGVESVLFGLSPSSPAILFNGHVDVVPASDSQFKARVSSGKIWGRGAYDMKAAVATMFVLLKNLSKRQERLPVGLLVVTDEEIGGSNGSKPYSEVFSKITKGVIIGEPTNLSIEKQAKAPIKLVIRTCGKRAHAAHLWEGVNAITKLSHEISKLSRVFKVPSGPRWNATVNFSMICGGLAGNQVPDHAEVTLDVRRTPQEKTSAILRKIRSTLVYDDTKIEIIYDEPSHSILTSSPLLKLLMNSIKAESGVSQNFISSNFASDARHFSSKRIPALCFGPSGDGMHSDDEFVYVESLRQYYNILERFVFKL
ncbi:MAG: M20 family metallopeptidase [Patescibacteria group bacterium]